MDDISHYMNRKYYYTKSTLENEDDISYYILGAFITDGCIYKNGISYVSQLSSKDDDWLNEIKNKLGTNLKIHKFKNHYYGIRIFDLNISKWFINHGCQPNKTYSVSLPEIPDQYLADFIRGCIDGDGSIGTYTYNNNVKRSCQIISASLPFLTAIQQKLKVKNIKSSIINRGKKDGIIDNKIIKANVDSFSLNVYGSNCFKLLKFAYYYDHKLNLNRKYLLAKKIIDYYQSKPILDMRKYPRTRKHKIQWSNDQELIQLINNSNIQQVAKKLNIHPTSIRKYLKSRNIYDKISKYQRIILPPKEKLEIMAQTMSYSEMAKQLCITIKTLRKKMKQVGLP